MTHHAAREDGVALITALLAVVILAGMAVVFTNRAVVETRASGTSQRWESTIHTTEAGADQQIAALNASDGHVTRDGANSEVTMVAADRDDERAWARGLVGQMRGSNAWVDDDLGESYAVRPRDAVTGEPIDAIYAVGATPSFDAPNAVVRSIKLQVAQDFFSPDFALLTDGPLKFGGNAKITSPGCDTSTPQKREETCIAHVHTNGSAEGAGVSADQIEGRVTVSGGTCGGVHAVNGCIHDGVAPQPIPPFTARDFYNRDADDLNPDPITGTNVEWFDLCPGGVVRSPSAGGPCTGTHRWPDPNDPDNVTDFYGWEWRGPQNTWRAQSLKAGVFYVYRADAEIRGTEGNQQRAVTVIVEGDPANPTRSGSLDITGNPRLQAALNGVLFVTDRDLDLRGNAGTGDPCGLSDSFSGFMGVGEQLDISGTVKLNGAIVVQDRDDKHNLVSRNNASIQGTMCLQYDEELVIDLTGIWVVTFWNEM